MLAASCKSAKERNLFVLALIFSVGCWALVAITLIGLLYAPFVALFVLLAQAFWIARITGNGVRVGTRQLPELYKRVVDACSKLGLQEVPEVYVVQMDGMLNAFATKLLSRKFIILNAEIVEACERASNGDELASKELDFVIGHELGHLALGHLSMAWLLLPSKLVPLLGPAYSRACEYSCDACGLAVVDDVAVASRALAVLAAGGRVAKDVNLDAFVEQRHDTGGFVMALVELNSTHPYLSKRVAALRRLKDSAVSADVGRNPFAYVLAPFFGASMGAVAQIYIMVAVVGMLAAIAVPNFLKFQERAKALQNAAPGAEHDFDDNDSAGGLGGLGLLGAVVDANAAGDDADANTAALQALIAQAKAQADAAAAQQGAEGGVEGGVVGGIVGEPAPPAREEARAFLKAQKKLKNPQAVYAQKTAASAAVVEKLYKLGAKKVEVEGIELGSEGTSTAAAIVVTLPEKPAVRKKLFAVCTGEYKKLGYSEPCVDEGDEAFWLTAE